MDNTGTQNERSECTIIDMLQWLNKRKAHRLINHTGAFIRMHFGVDVHSELERRDLYVIGRRAEQIAEGGTVIFMDAVFDAYNEWHEWKQKADARSNGTNERNGNVESNQKDDA